MKAIQTAYSPATVAAFEGFNCKLDALAADRTAIQTERDAVFQDALLDVEKSSALRKRIAGCVERALDCDRRELILLATELPELEKIARADWKAEAEKHTEIEAERVEVLNKHAAELGMNEPQRHRLVVEDKTRQRADQAHKAARDLAVQPGVITDEDKRRVLELRKVVEQAFR